MQRAVVGVVFTLFSCSPSVWAHKEDAHAAMSAAAARSSILANESSDLLSNLGLNMRYVGLDPADPAYQTISDGTDARTIIGWIEYGSIFEDDTETLKRPLNHFFDPQNDRPLTVLGIPLGETSPDWVLEGGREIDSQHYSLRDARDYFYRALTATSKSDRDKNFGLTFQTLGHVIHHLQDMAQPQHVRNDQHLDQPKEFLGVIPNPFYNPSRYEEYTNNNRTQDLVAAYLAPNGYPVPAFPRARDFWHTDHGNPGVGRGIAEFTNSNFLSQGTNFVNAGQGNVDVPISPASYPRPAWNGLRSIESFSELMAQQPECRGVDPSCGKECLPPEGLPPACSLAGEMVFYGTDVQDNYLGGAPQANPRASTLSVFDQDLQPKDRRLFALNRFNFDATYPHLIPKAVAYSAGLIDFFFRGRIEVLDVSAIGSQIVVEIKNVSASPNHFSNGRFELFYDAIDGGRRPLPVTQNATTELAVGARLVLTVTKPTLDDVDLSKETQLILVYRGRVGEEEGIAAAVLEMPLSGFIVQPNFRPADGKEGPRHIYRGSSGWQLNPGMDLKAGLDDWKGWYVNGRPTKVLSWTAGEIYENGRLLAVAPCGILGAALSRDADGRAWVVAICYDELTESDVVYRRRARRSDSRATYDPADAPFGWHQVLRQPRESGHFRPQTMWVFNGSGTEAQTMRAAEKTVVEIDAYGNSVSTRKNGSDRLRLSMNTGRIENLGNLAGYRKRVVENTVTPRSADIGCGRSVYVGGDSTQIVEQTGEYIIAVDYRDDEERLVKISQSYTYRVTSNLVYDWEAVQGSGTLCRESLRRTWSDTQQTRTGSETVSINDRQLFVRHTVDGSKSHHCDSNNRHVVGMPHGVRGSGTGVGASTTVSFIDPRDGLVVLSEQNDRQSEEYSTSEGLINYVGHRHGERRDTIRSDRGAAGEVLVHSESEDAPTQHASTLEVFSHCALGVELFDKVLAVDFPGRYPVRTFSTSGGWVLGAEDVLLASQDKGRGSFGSRAGQLLGAFQYVTGGDLLTIVPGSGDGSQARFDPPRLIR